MAHEKHDAKVKANALAVPQDFLALYGRCMLCY